MEMLWKCYEHLGNAMENGHFNGKLIEVPSGKPTKKRWKITMFNGYINYINYKWSFSIATLNYQRVPPKSCGLSSLSLNARVGWR
jgi:hypothetical protein